MEGKKKKIGHVTHLFLKDCPIFLTEFLSHLAKEFPFLELTVSSMKAMMLEKLLAIYDKGRFSEWREKGIDLSKAVLEWSTEEENSRQKQVLKLFNECIYDVLAMIERWIMIHGGISSEKIDSAIRSIYFSTIQAVAKARREDISPSGKVDLQTSFTIPLPDDTVLKVVVHYSQMCVVFVSSLDPRNNPENVHPINAHIDEVIMTAPDGEKWTSRHARSGSFDFFGIQGKKSLSQISPEKITEELKHLLCLNDEELKNYIDAIRLNRNIDQLHLLVETLAWVKIFQKSVSEILKKHVEKLPKYHKELTNLFHDQAIIQANRRAIEQLIESGTSARMGFSIPSKIREIFSSSPLLGKSGWGLISLQTPHNLMNSTDMEGEDAHDHQETCEWPAHILERKFGGYPLIRNRHILCPNGKGDNSQKCRDQAEQDDGLEGGTR